MNSLIPLRHIDNIPDYIKERYPLFVSFMKEFYNVLLNDRSFDIVRFMEDIKTATDISKFVGDSTLDTMASLYFKESGAAPAIWNEAYTQGTKIKVVKFINEIQSMKNSVEGMKVLEYFINPDSEYKIFNGRDVTVTPSGALDRSKVRFLKFIFPDEYESILGYAREQVEKYYPGNYYDSVFVLDGINVFVPHLFENGQNENGHRVVYIASADSRLESVATSESHVLSVITPSGSKVELLEWDFQASETAWDIKVTANISGTPVPVGVKANKAVNPLIYDLEDSLNVTGTTHKGSLYPIGRDKVYITGVTISGFLSSSDWNIYNTDGKWLAGKTGQTIRHTSVGFDAYSDISDAVTGNESYIQAGVLASTSGLFLDSSALIPVSGIGYITFDVEVGDSYATIGVIGKDHTGTTQQDIIDLDCLILPIGATVTIAPISFSTVSRPYIVGTSVGRSLMQLSSGSMVSDGQLYSRQGIQAPNRRLVSVHQTPTVSIDSSIIPVLFRNISLSSSETVYGFIVEPLEFSESIESSESVTLSMTEILELTDSMASGDSLDVTVSSDINIEASLTSGEVLYSNLEGQSLQVSFSSAETSAVILNEQLNDEELSYSVTVSESGNSIISELDPNAVISVSFSSSEYVDGNMTEQDVQTLVAEFISSCRVYSGVSEYSAVLDPLSLTSFESVSSVVSIQFSMTPAVNVASSESSVVALEVLSLDNNVIDVQLHSSETSVSALSLQEPAIVEGLLSSSENVTGYVTIQASIDDLGIAVSTSESAIGTLGYITEAVSSMNVTSSEYSIATLGYITEVVSSMNVTNSEYSIATLELLEVESGMLISGGTPNTSSMLIT